MIGVIADPAEHDIAREFFELFKTPWEFYRENRHYQAILCTGDCQIHGPGKVIVCYSGKKTQFDDERKIRVGGQGRNAILKYQEKRIPIYGESITFPHSEYKFLASEGSGESAFWLEQSEERVHVRIGYDLFAEIRTLLTVGQPVANARMPALELHIALFRDLITSCGVSLVEVPPVPAGFQFIACLTHDVDHPAVRQHKLDHTILGFLWRAILGSLVDTVRGWMPLRDAVKNWAAAVKLPFVYGGLAQDFWSDFADRYLEVEGSLPSTFFFIPRKNYPGKGIDSRAKALRAAPYEAKELADTIRKLTTAGCEVGLHGIDAWLDSSAGHEEIEEIRRLTRAQEIGVRMHWLYYNEKSPAALEKSGASYDSTIGYNETVGYRAGTTQAFRPLEAERLLELPLHAMDTALFYLSYLGLSPKEASARLGQIADDTAQYGGCVTINWHDRSLAPERLWGGCYRKLIADLKTRGAWFTTARQAVAWFRKRRSVAFEVHAGEPGGVRARVVSRHDDGIPGLLLRVHKPRTFNDFRAQEPARFADIPIEGSIEATENAHCSETLG